MRDDAVRKKRLDDRQPGQGDVVCPLVDVNDGAHGVDGVGQLGEETAWCDDEITGAGW